FQRDTRPRVALPAVFAVTVASALLWMVQLAVAAAHHISLSYLHRLFAQRAHGETVAATIRSRRLEHARRDLENPALRTTPLYAIAARWGLPRAGEFSRAFKSAYGISPGEYRLRALRDTGTRS
ncbi:helix-turn-helix transcriptional regulator, partial [Streptomyces sp. NPDC048845]|uniref:helix-turn-helix transcriptional regulator n=1 Tax=Streptomyces sp. NPDC048845 TaxID=3155390 RepID=UPI00341EFF65